MFHKTNILEKSDISCTPILVVPHFLSKLIKQIFFLSYSHPTGVKTNKNPNQNLCNKYSQSNKRNSLTISKKYVLLCPLSSSTLYQEVCVLSSSQNINSAVPLAVSLSPIPRFLCRLRQNNWHQSSSWSVLLLPYSLSKINVFCPCSSSFSL